MTDRCGFVGMLGFEAGGASIDGVVSLRDTINGVRSVAEDDAMA